MRKTRGSYSNPGKMDRTIKDLAVPDNLYIAALQFLITYVLSPRKRLE